MGTRSWTTRTPACPWSPRSKLHVLTESISCTITLGATFWTPFSEKSIQKPASSSAEPFPSTVETSTVKRIRARGKVTLTEHIEDGLDQFPYALQKLFTGETIG